MRIEGLPEGYEVVRWGDPKLGELFVHREGVEEALFDFKDDPCLIVRKLEPVLDVSKIRLKKG